MGNLRGKLWGGFGGIALLLAGAAGLTFYDAPRWVIVTAIVAAGAAAAAFIRHLDTILVGPLRWLHAMVLRIQAGDLGPQKPVDGSHELARLSQSIQTMAGTLRQARQAEEERLHRLKGSTQLAINALPHGVAVMSPTGVVELSNEVATRVFGLAPGLTAGDGKNKWVLPLVEAVAKTHAPEPPRGAGGAVQVFEGGKELFFMPRALPMLEENGNLRGITLLLVDETAGRRVDEAQHSLASTLSHELKTPLTSIQMCILLLLDDPALTLNAKQRDLLVAARDDTERLHRMIGEVLERAKS